ncbi:MAG: insulinase family protein [Myxococcales bacterium]|nr:insulinase family protein [Myxococcales bacterium]
MRRFSTLALALLLASACGSPPPADAPTVPGPSASAGAPPEAVGELDRALPVDARVIRGKLENGLTYYVLPHGKPEKRAQVWLAVDAGSVLEDEDQRGLAHFVEHMGFNGTKRFPKQQLVDFLEKSGVRFGADLNAYTSFDETVYTLQVPTDAPDTLRRSITVLRDWADGISFEPAEVEKERGVVLEEWRLGRGARMRVFDKQAPVLFHGSKYADRLTIGKPEVIQRASRDTLVRFYRDWYRPDLMAVIAVGDFDAKAMEATIRAEFGSLPKPKKARARTRVTLPAHAKTLVSIETDPELPNTTVAVMSKLPHRPEASARDYRRTLTEQLADSMLDARLDELKRKPDAPFLSASSSTGGLVRTADSFRQTAMVKDDGVLRGLSALLEEVARAERFGFTQTELDRAKSQLLRNFQQAVKERDKRDGSEFASEIVRHFFEAEAMPGREAELRLVERFLPEIALSELNGLVKQLGSGSRLLVVTGPDKMQKPTAEALLALHEQVRAKKLEAYVDAGSNQPLMKGPPKPGSVVKVGGIPELGVTEWTLSNGVRVIVKPTDFANDQVRVSAFSPGGHSLAKDADFESARFADVAVGQGGLGPFDAVQLRKALAGKLVSVNATIAELEEGLSGRAAPADVETLFQMMHLAFVAPRRDAEAFAAWRAREAESVKNRRMSPEGVFYEDMAVFSSQNHLRRRPVTPERLEKVDLDKAFGIYKDRFADASDFTFVFVGNVELDRLKPLVEAYLASLPSTKRKESWRDPKVLLPPGVKSKTVAKGSEPKSMVSLTFHGSEKWSRETENDMRALGEVLRLRLRQVLREDMGGVYGVQVGGGITRRPRQEYRFGVSFGCAPENVEKLKQAVFDEIAAVQKDGVTEDYVMKVKEARRRAHQTELKDNGYWLRELERAYVFGDDPRLIVDIEPMLAKVSSDRIKAAAKKYISNKQYLLGVLAPEAATGKQP